MYKVKEAFEYLVDDYDDFCSVQDMIDWEKELGTDASWQDIENVPEHDYKSSPWGNSVIEVVNNDISVNKDTLLKLIRNSEKLLTLEECGVDNWINYGEAMQYLDDSPDEVLLKQYLDD